MAAARELSLTRGAVSRTIKELEQFMGVRLFVRSARGVRLSEAGRNYARAVGPAIGEIARASIELRLGSRDRLLRLPSESAASAGGKEHATT